MSLANQRLPDGNQILAGIMSRFISILGKRKFLRGGHWDFRFCGFGYLLDRFLGFCCKRLRFFGFGGHCGLRIFSFFSIWFSVFVKNTSGFSVLESMTTKRLIF